MSERTVYGVHARLVCAMLILVAWTAAQADIRVTVADSHPVVEAVMADDPPLLDGQLDDPVWAVAANLSDFYVPNLDRYPTEQTIVWLAYDDSCLYFAARCFDTHPDLLRMDQTRRGGDVLNDDFIALGLDLHNQHKEKGEHVFRVTPRGVQDETIPDGSASKVEWRGDWRAAAKVDSLGWTVEAAIPLAMFNQTPGAHTVGVTIKRWIPRTQEDILWPNMGATWDQTRAGDWDGVIWPDRRRKPRFMPYVVGEWEEGSPGGYFGLDMKHTGASGITYVATVYPDFQNVEAEVLGLDFSYTELVRDDNRPFFAEGDRYLPEDWMFYSNRVGEIYGGTKVFGQAGDHGFGLIETYDKEDVNHMAGQWEWVPADRVEMETKFVWRHGPASAVDSVDGPPVRDNLMVVNELVAGRVVGRGTEDFRIQSGLTQSSGSAADGWNLEASWMRDPGNGEIGWSLRGRLLSKGFITIDGSFDDIDADQRDLDSDLWYEIEFDRTWFHSFGFENDARYSTRFNGDLYVRENALEVWAEIIPGSGTWVLGTDQERPPYHDRTLETGFWWNANRLYTGGEVGTVFGRVKDGDFLLVWFEQHLQPLPRLTTSVSTQWRRHDLPVGHVDRPLGGVEERYQVIGSAQFDITTERAISGRIIRSDDGVNGYATFQQVVRSGMDLFLIVGDPSADTWTNRVALKAMIVLGG